MNCNIKTADGRIGLDPIVYTSKPAKTSDFINAQEIERAFYEPQNLIEEFTQIFTKAKRNLSNMFQQ